MNKKRIVSILCLLAATALLIAQVPPPPPASQAEVDAGIVTSKYVSPATLASRAGGGSGWVSNFYGATYVASTRYTNSTPYFAEFSLEVTFATGSGVNSGVNVSIDNDANGSTDYLRTYAGTLTVGDQGYTAMTTIYIPTPPGGVFALTNVGTAPTITGARAAVVYYTTNGASGGGGGGSVTPADVTNTVRALIGGFPTNVGTFSTFTNSTPGLTNSYSALHRGGLWLSPAVQAGPNWTAGAINWMNYGQTISDYASPTQDPFAKIQFFPEWGFNTSGGDTMLITAHSLRLENSFGGGSHTDYGTITIGNEDEGGKVMVNYTPLTPTRNSIATNGWSFPVNFVSLSYDSATNVSTHLPGIIGRPAQGAPLHGPAWDQNREGELWFSSYNGRPIRPSDWASYPPTPVFIMRTNSVDFFGDVSITNYLRVGNIQTTNGMKSLGTVYIGTGSGALGTSGLDVCNGNAPSIYVGGDLNADTRTSGAAKKFSMVMAPKTNSNPALRMIAANFSDSSPLMDIGGGSGLFGAFAGVDFYAGSSPHTAGAGTVQFSIRDGYVQIYNGLYLGGTVTATGTTSTQTINKPSGSVNIAAGSSSVTVNNNLVGTSTLVFAVIQTNDSTAQLKNVVPGSGSFVIRLTANATAETRIAFQVINTF